MSGNRLLIDTNIALYLLSGDQTIARLLDENQIFLSFITELEILGYPDLSDNDLRKIDAFLQNCKIVNLNEQIKTEAIRIKRLRKMKLPDAIIAATAFYLDIPLFSADSGFASLEGLSLILYKVPLEEE